MILPGIRFFSTARMPSIAPSSPDTAATERLVSSWRDSDLGQHLLHVVERRAAGADEIKLLFDVGVEVELGGLVGRDAGEDVDDAARGGSRNRLRHQRRHRRHQDDVVELARRVCPWTDCRAQRERCSSWPAARPVSGARPGARRSGRRQKPSLRARPGKGRG